MHGGAGFRFCGVRVGAEGLDADGLTQQPCHSGMRHLAQAFNAVATPRLDHA
jgi:hypothetical protein